MNESRVYNCYVYTNDTPCFETVTLAGQEIEELVWQVQREVTAVTVSSSPQLFKHQPVRDSLKCQHKSTQVKSKPPIFPLSHPIHTTSYTSHTAYTTE